jgi:hypothetical protein
LDPIAPPALIAGVFAHVVERLVHGDDGTGGHAPRHVSVGTIFETAMAQGITTRAFNRRLPDDVGFEPEHRARIQQALDAGLIVVSPGRTVSINGRQRLGWWLIDPATGAAVDEMEDGRGATNDYVVVVPAAGAFGAAVANYGWSVLNLGMKYAADPKISRAMSRLYDALMAMNPPGGNAGS